MEFTLKYPAVNRIPGKEESLLQLQCQGGTWSGIQPAGQEQVLLIRHRVFETLCEGLPPFDCDAKKLWNHPDRF